MDAKQLINWYRYAKHVGRFGVDRNDIHFGLVASAAATCMGGRADPERYMPYYDRYAEDLTEEELARRLGLEPLEPTGSSVITTAQAEEVWKAGQPKEG